MTTLQIRFRKASFLDLKRGLKTFQQEALINGTVGLVEGAERIRKASIEEVPKDTRALAQSTFLTDRIVPTSMRSQVRVGYGGTGVKINPRTKEPTTKYMVEVHENLAQGHRNGKAKFLEDPVNRLLPEIIELVAQYISQSKI